MKIDSFKTEEAFKDNKDPFRKRGQAAEKDPELEALLKQYMPPEIRPDIRRSQITQLSADIRNIDYLPCQSFSEQILTQLSFISGWVWPAQAGILFLIFYYVFRTDLLLLNMILSCLAPGLSLILICEISKSFRANIWEMEAACRYNLAQIFFFRLSILFGGDFVVLTCALIAYRMADGLLWQFCFYAVLPFFLTSAVSLYILRRFGSRCSPAMTAALPLPAGFFVYWTMPLIKAVLLQVGASLTGSIPIITLLAFALLLYNAIRLCTDVRYLSEKPRKTA